MKPVIVVGSDHAGFRAKEFTKRYLINRGYWVEDVRTDSLESVDYPDFAEKLALAVLRGRGRMGILTCGTGIGASIAANKVPGIRAALVCNAKDARLSIEDKGGRHARRVRKIAGLEKRYLKVRGSA